jgi:hypothetical protein
MTGATMETPVQCFHASIAAVLPVVMLPPWAGMARAQLSKRTPMPKLPKKSDFPVSQVRRYLEPGPIVLVSSK